MFIVIATALIVSFMNGQNYEQHLQKEKAKTEVVKNEKR